MNKLVIVESPNKIKAISKYLGKDYVVKASVGHIAYLPASGAYGLGIDLENWQPLMKMDPEKRAICKELKEAADKSELVYIATDPDREGESIGQNLVDILKLKNYKRIVYNEITEQAIKNAINNPKMLDENLITAQKTRRMLDRIIGFRLSKLMKHKFSNIPSAPSAGRVQSIALKLVIEREKLVENFVAQKYFNIIANLDQDYQALLYLEENQGDKNWINEDQVDKIYNSLSGKLTIKKIKHSTRKDSKATPFKQAVLYKRSSLTSTQVQSASQKLFEGFGDDGLITYPRTDSTRLSQYFIENAHKYIEKTYGLEYVSKEIKGFAGDQDAHEAIRPTNLELTPEKARSKYNLKREEYETYKLIYNNTLQAIMSVPIREITSYTLEDNGNIFKFYESKILFDGYFKAIGFPEIKAPYSQNKKLQEDDIIEVQEYIKQEKTTKPPARYNDGSLIEALDNIKVGRPSTFATTVNILKKRGYVDQIERELIPTNFGKEVNEKLITGFPTIINEDYTASVEKNLDEIAEGKSDHKILMSEFWNLFEKNIDDAYKTMEKTILIPSFVGENCPLDNQPLVYRKNNYGKGRYIACSAYPKCSFTRSEQKFNFFKKTFLKDRLNEEQK
ncbi:type I DNA topoisomerase [Mycoplasmopsis pulmonis]|nr:type I DNA topoisomerase [Mycoplasmopsis pulmonis]MDZ7293520.1 type I DNA topoisomerase [Mycoplasmopsis pulmonis]VEU68235.1 DNA topoisomerase 1 [Mycoplasmopsis pulmonis]